MRRIGAHFIYLPGFELMKGGYAEFHAEQLERLIQKDVAQKEFAGLEFYAGLLVTYEAAIALKESGETDIITFLQTFYLSHPSIERLAVITGIDYTYFRLTPHFTLSVITK